MELNLQPKGVHGLEQSLKKVIIKKKILSPNYDNCVKYD
jgi:hypothetical protein